MTYYTYIHYDLDNNPFYVGKGKGDRAFSNKDRGCQWWTYVRKCQGYTIKIVNYFETEDEAFVNEQELISEFSSKGLFLANLTKGGKGASGYKQSEKSKEHKRQLMTGYKHKIIECPHCGKVGGETTMKRWHFDNCNGLKPYKSRVTVLGKRIYLGYHETKEKADAVAKEFYDFVMEEYEAIKTVTVPSGSRWVVL